MTYFDNSFGYNEMGDIMEKWIACHENAGIFIGKDKAFDWILNSNQTQRNVFIKTLSFDEILKHALSFYGEQSIVWNEPTIYLKVLNSDEACVINEHGIWIEKDSAWAQFLKRLNKTWRIEDESHHVLWIGSCIIAPNCVK